MRNIHRKGERGFSLIIALLALMLLSAVGIGMMYTSTTETAVSGNFKAEETAYFAARAGIEEARDRLIPVPGNTAAYTIAPAVSALTMPGGGAFALYILNGGTTMADVTSLSSTNLLADDELCHDFPNQAGMSYVAPNIRCGTLPAGGWYTSTTSVTSTGGAVPLPMDYKWVRVTLKANNTYGGATPTSFVDSAMPGTNQVCLSGNSAGAYEIAPSAAGCAATTSPVYLLTALAMTRVGSGWARRIVQQEVAQYTNNYNLPGGLFAVGNGCGALSLGGGVNTGSFNSAAEATKTNPPSNLANSGGDVGTNGNASLDGGVGSTNIHGNIYTGDPTGVGPCPANGLTVSGSPAYSGMAGGLAPPPIAVPPMPNPLPPTTAQTYRGAQSLPAGAYGNVVIKGPTTLVGGASANNPAIFTMNSLALNGGGTLTITGYVVLNLAGVGQSTVLDLSGGGFANMSYDPRAFIINYGGTDNIYIGGGGQAYAEIDAPNAAITFRGGSDFYGQAIGRTIDDRGGTNFYWDTSLQPPPAVNTSTFHEIAMRELTY
jgi:type II secretory pathway pseudopilin PulG